MPMDRLWNWRSAAALGLMIVASIGSAGCRNRDLRVPPVPRYSNEATAPGPGAPLSAAEDPYGGMNPYANTNLGTGSPSAAAGSDTYASNPYAGVSATPPAADPAGSMPAALPSPMPYDPSATPVGGVGAQVGLPSMPADPALPEAGPLP